MSKSEEEISPIAKSSLEVIESPSELLRSITEESILSHKDKKKQNPDKSQSSRCQAPQQQKFDKHYAEVISGI